MASWSFRIRLLVGTILWTLGLLALSHLLFLVFARRHSFVFRIDHRTLIAIAAVGMLAGLWEARRGLLPFRRLRESLAAVREGTAPRIEGRFPSEVQPLVNDLNALLAHREETVRRAMAKAGDLAHGLKTPLAVLTQEAELAGAQGHPELAAAFERELDRMRRQIDYYLVHARAAGAGAATPGARSSVRESADGLARALGRLHAERGVSIDLAVPAELSVRVERQELDEMLGNLLDNACRFARSAVTVRSSQEGERVAIMVDDDGPGLDPSLREAVLQRGVRADEAASGSGFGLAIVRDLAELSGGSVSLESSPAGGLRAHLELPGA